MDKAERILSMKVGGGGNLETIFTEVGQNPLAGRKLATDLMPAHTKSVDPHLE